VILALVASLLAAVSIGQLSKHMPTSGSYTHVSNGIHPAVGSVAWGSRDPLGGLFLALQMGFVVAGTTTRVGLVAGSLRVWTVLGCLLVFWLGYRGIRSTKTASCSVASRSSCSSPWR
jgi:amino acid transporter